MHVLTYHYVYVLLCDYLEDLNGRPEAQRTFVNALAKVGRC